MKKFLLSLGLLCALLPLRAQYFQKEYNVLNADFISDGAAVGGGTSELLLTGFKFVLGQTQTFSVVHTDNNGAVGGAGTYSKQCTLVKNSVAVPAFPKEVLHVGGVGGTTVVVGNYSDTNGGGVFCATFSYAGTVLSVKEILPSITTTEFKVDAACVSTYNSNQVFLTGHVNTDAVSSTLGTGSFIVCIDVPTNSVVWGRFYNNILVFTDEIEIPVGIVCSPFTSQLVVAGNSVINDTSRVYAFGVNPLNGNVSFIGRYYYPGEENIATGLVASNTTAGGGTGFIVCGNVFRNNAYDAWAFKFSNTGFHNVLWSKTYDYSLGGSNTAEDIVTRVNTSGLHTYFLSGIADLGSQGGDDMVVLEIDGAGNFRNETSYGTNVNEYGMALDVVQGSGADGLAIFGGVVNGASGTRDLYAVKTYFNGKSGCFQGDGTSAGVNLTTVMSASGSMGSELAGAEYPTGPLSLTVSSAGTVSTRCFSINLRGGDNARLAEGEEEMQQQPFTAYPNPVSGGEALNIETYFSSGAEVIVSICDLSGRVVQTETIAVQKDQTLLRVQLPQLAAGTYVLTLSSPEGLQQARIVVR